MLSNTTWIDEYNKELERAMQARRIGNEGMARVCARRAAGIVIGEYLSLRSYPGLNDSSYDRLNLFSQLPDVPEDCKAVSRHLLMKVNQEHNLPVGTDLIQEVIWLKDYLLPNSDH